MVTHGEAGRVPHSRSAAANRRRLISWLAAVVVPSALCAVTALFLDDYLKIPGETALFFVGVLFVALLGGIAPAAFQRSCPGYC